MTDRPTFQMERYTDDVEAYAGQPAVRYSFGEPGAEGHFADTLHGEWADQDDAGVQAEAESRYDAWRETTAPQEPTPETPETLAENIDAVTEQIRDLTRQRLDLEDRKKALEADRRTFTWLGATGSWNDPTKWDEGEVPGHGDVVVIPVDRYVAVPKGVGLVGTVEAAEASEG